MQKEQWSVKWEANAVRDCVSSVWRHREWVQRSSWITDLLSRWKVAIVRIALCDVQMSTGELILAVILEKGSRNQCTSCYGPDFYRYFPGFQLEIAQIWLLNSKLGFYFNLKISKFWFWGQNVSKVWLLSQKVYNFWSFSAIISIKILNFGVLGSKFVKLLLFFSFYFNKKSRNSGFEVKMCQQFGYNVKMCQNLDR